METYDKPQETVAAEARDLEREHQTYINVCQAYEEAGKKRGGYRRYGTLFVILSGVVFLTLMFSLEYKIEFLILWVITDIFCMVLMIRSEYRVHQIAEMLGLPDEDPEEHEEAHTEGQDEQEKPEEEQAEAQEEEK